MNPEMFSLKGRRALVCGASQGIGRAAAVALADLGAQVVALARSKEKLEELEKEIGAEVLVADLDNRPNTQSVVERHIAAQGPIHILLNNTSGPAPGPLLEAPEEAFTRAFARHILAAQMLTKLCLPGMREARFGRIINIISTSVKEPIANLGVSNVIRGAMAAWSKTLANELPPAVTVNNILPGYTETPRLQSLRQNLAQRKGSEEAVNKMWIEAIPERRIADPKEIAHAVAFLASPGAAYVRGVNLAVDGGRMRSI